MTNLTLEQAIEQAGGAATEENCPAVMPKDHFLSIWVSVVDIGQRLGKILDKRSPGVWGAIVLKNSISYGCQVQPIKDNGYAILVPIGMLARIRVLSRLLLSYWQVDKAIRVIRSPLDNVPGDSDAIPPLLRPLFLEEDDPNYWEKLLELDKTVLLDERAEHDVQELVHVALLFIVAHEFTHILHGHFDLLRRAETEKLSLTKSELRRGIELDADDGGAAIAINVQFEAIQDAIAKGQDAQFELGWLRLAYAVTMVFAITDTHRKYFGAYDAGAYNHPMVRCELFFNSVRNCLADSDESFIEVWDANSDDGWKRCVLALENLTVDALKGKFGKLAEGVQPAPIHTLNYSATPNGITDRETFRKCKLGHKLMWQVRKLLPIFAETFANNPQALEYGQDVSVTPGLDDEPVIGVCGLEQDALDALKGSYGDAAVIVYAPPEIPEDIEGEERSAQVAALNVKRAEFYESVNHMVLTLSNLESFSLFTASMIQVQLGLMATVTCISVGELGNVMRQQINRFAEDGIEPSVEQLESEGKLLFLREFDLSALKKQITREKEFRHSKSEP